MNTPASSSPGPSTPGGELQQISPGAWPTGNGSQVENSAPAILAPAAATRNPVKRLLNNWDRVKNALRQKHVELTDHDLHLLEGFYIEDETSAMVDYIHEKTGHSREEIEDLLDLSE